MTDYYSASMSSAKQTPIGRNSAKNINGKAFDLKNALVSKNESQEEAIFV